jgi:hypothetical protein
MQGTPDVVSELHQLWPWMWQNFGLLGTLLVSFLAVPLCLAWLVTPIGVWLLYRRSYLLEQRLLELQERTASQNRQQQVERIQRDRVRKKPPRRR